MQWRMEDRFSMLDKLPKETVVSYISITYKGTRQIIETSLFYAISLINLHIQIFVLAIPLIRLTRGIKHTYQGKK